MRSLHPALVLALLATGCTDTKHLVIHECKLVLRHSTTEPAWQARRAKCEAQVQLEDPDDPTAGTSDPSTPSSTSGGK